MSNKELEVRSECSCTSKELLHPPKAHFALESVTLIGELGVELGAGGSALAAQLLNRRPDARRQPQQLHLLEDVVEFRARE